MRIWTNGCFDMLHLGHMEFLRRCESYGDLTVFMNSDISVKELKGDTRPIINEDQRARQVVLACRNALVHMFDDVTPIAVWEGMIHRELPDLYIKEASAHNSVEVAYLQARGVATAFVKRIPGVSTTEIIARCAASHGARLPAQPLPHMPPL